MTVKLKSAYCFFWNHNERAQPGADSLDYGVSTEGRSAARLSSLAARGVSSYFSARPAAAELRVELRDSMTDFVQGIEIRLPESRFRFF